MMARGVFSSWLASVMNCFCILEFFSKGLTIRFERKENTTEIMTMNARAISDSMRVSISTPVYSSLKSTNTTMLSSSLTR